MSCIYVRNNINALPLLEFCTRDATTVRIIYAYGGGCEELIVASAHLPYDSDEPSPTKEVRDINDYCYNRKKQLFIVCDAKTQHTLCRSKGTNPRGESFVQFRVRSNLNIRNHGNESTFVVCNRKEVIDLTLGTNTTANLVSNRHVSDEPSFSDYRYICFQIGNITANQITFRDPRRTNWNSYKNNLRVNLETMSRRIHTIRDMDRSVDQLQQAIILSYCNNCPAKTTLSPKMVPWWKTRRLFNIGKRTGQWDS
jgi:hypothetical protein